MTSLERSVLDPASPPQIQEGDDGSASPNKSSKKQIMSDAMRASSIVLSSKKTEFAEAAAMARANFLSEGYDPDSFFEQHIVWGDLDSFRHVNNTRYSRFIESSRAQWVARMSEKAGGVEAVVDILYGRGICPILKTFAINFKRPVVFPDTLLILIRPRPTNPPSPMTFQNDAVIYSYAQRAVVATSEEVLVWYDFDNHKKAPPTETMRKALEARMKADL